MNANVFLVKNASELTDAFAKLTNGGTVVIANSIVLEKVTLPRHIAPITVTSVFGGEDYRKSGARLVFESSVTVTLGGELIFQKTVIDVKTSGVFAAAFNPLTFGEEVEVECNLAEEANGLYLVGGYNNSPEKDTVYEKDSSITLMSGKISRLVGFSRGCIGAVHTGKAKLAVSGCAYVRYAVAGAMGEGATAGSAELYLNDNAVVEALHMGGGKKENTLSGNMDVYIYGGDLYRFDTVGLTAVKGKKSLVYDPKNAPDGLLFLAKLVLFDSIKSTCDVNGHSFGEPYAGIFEKDAKIHTCSHCGHTEPIEKTNAQAFANTLFVADGGYGDGSSPACPCGSYEDAISALAESGGTVVIVKECTVPTNLTDLFGKVPDAFQEKRRKEQITVTSCFNGTDYRDRGAKLIFPKTMDYRVSGPLLFENIVIDAKENATANRIVARYNPITFGDGCVTPTRQGYKLDVIGGYLQFRYTDLDGCKIDDEYLEIVNACRPLPVDHSIKDLVPIKEHPNLCLREEAAKAFNKMFEDMAAAGLKVPYVSDAYRPYSKQYSLLTGFICNHRRTYGYSFEQARSIVMRSCALPTCSEHQQGVAVDMYNADMVQYGGKKHHYYDITPEWAWVKENGAKYGIVLRYLSGKNDITGFIYEAWHFRYVGKEVATVLRAREYTLEEYMGARLGLYHLDASVTVNSGVFHRITPYSAETGAIQFTGKHYLSVSDKVTVLNNSADTSGI